jgi:outer membrane scaffolding protein for murein synthesis (MipA/OmpV family)
VAEPPLPDVEGAIGAVLSYGPEILGSTRYGASLSPVGYLRYKRLTISSGAGGFVNRRADDLVSGLALDLVNQEKRRLSLSLRLDRGRREQASQRLTGLGDVPTTVRLRMAGTWQIPAGWRAHAAWTVDAFNRGGGNLAELGLGYEHRLAPRTVYSLSARLSVAGPRYQQTYFGVTETQAAASGYPVYSPGLGLRDLQLSAGFRTDLGPHWGLQAGLGLQRLLGPSARSPIVQRANAWSTSAGLVWRF